MNTVEPKLGRLRNKIFTHRRKSVIINNPGFVKYTVYFSLINVNHKINAVGQRFSTVSVEGKKKNFLVLESRLNEFEESRKRRRKSHSAILTKD